MHKLLQLIHFAFVKRHMWVEQIAKVYTPNHLYARLVSSMYTELRWVAMFWVTILPNVYLLSFNRDMPDTEFVDKYHIVMTSLDRHDVQIHRLFVNSENTKSPSLLTLCEENPSVAGGLPSQKAVIWKAFPCQGEEKWDRNTLGKPCTYNHIPTTMYHGLTIVMRFLIK